MNTQQILEEFNTVGMNLSKIDAELATVEAYGPGGRGDLMMPHVNAAHDAVAIAGRAMARAAQILQQGIGGATPPQAGHGLPPGQVVADVGTLPADQGAFDGQVNPTLMTLWNWGYYARQNLGAKSGHIFDRPFTIGNADTGVTYDEGTLVASYQNADPIVRDALGNTVADLSQWG